MKLNQPKNITWFISLGLIVVGVLGHIVPITFLAGFDFWLAVLGGALLLLGTLFKGL